MILHSTFLPVLTVIACLLLVCSPLRAQDRVLRRTALANKASKLARAAHRKQVLKQSAECTSKNTRRGNLKGYACQLKLIDIVSNDLDLDPEDPKALKAMIKKRVLLAAAAAELGRAIAQFEPVDKPAKYDRLRFEGRTLSCRITGNFYDALRDLPPGSFDAEMLKKGAGLGSALEGHPLKDSVCGCAQQAGQLAMAASIPPSDALANEMQRSLYGRGCFLNVKGTGSSLVDIKRAAPGSGPSGPALPSAAKGDDARRLSFAKSRVFQIEHCRDRFGNRRQRAVDVKKLKRCVCETVQRWRFPTGDQPTANMRVSLVKGQAHYTVSVLANGRVDSCDVELEGKLKKK